MTLYDSSLLIDYLDGDERAVDYVTDHVDERAITVPLVQFEVYQGEIFRSEPPDFDAVERSLAWLSVVDGRPEYARAAAELQDGLQSRGETLAARDAFVAGAAWALEEPLAASDGDFDVDAEAVGLDVDLV